jgi:hypothetical protein
MNTEHTLYSEGKLLKLKFEKYIFQSIKDEVGMWI